VYSRSFYLSRLYIVGEFDMPILEYGRFRMHYEHEDASALPGVCIYSIAGPGLPSFQIMPGGSERAEEVDLVQKQGRIVFNNGLEEASRLTLPIFNPNLVRRPDWKARIRTPNHPWKEGAKPPYSIHDCLEPIHSRFHVFGRYQVYYHSSLFPNDPTVTLISMIGPGLGDLRLTPDGVEPAAGTGIEGVEQLLLGIKITRDDLQ
jgi:hypothetical protein